MGTRWRALLAPIDTVTGDGRRFLEFTNRALPLPHRWQRLDTQGHDDSVVVGLTDNMAYLSVADAIVGGWISEETAAKANLDRSMMAVWGQGEFFDDIDAHKMPRLAEDVAEAMHLSGSGVLGPSVGAGAAEFFGYVHAGTSNLITDEDIMTAEFTGVTLNVEALFAHYEIAESTLVPVPAFSQTSQPFEILTGEMAALTAASRPAVDLAARATIITESAAERVAVTVPATVFDVPADLPADYYQPLTVEDRGEGFLRVSGWLAAFDVCHVAFRDDCYTAPASQMDYVPFNRYPIDVLDTEGQLTTISVGRLTTGLGTYGTGCSCCPGKDDHACDFFELGRAMDHYDQLHTVAHVKVTEVEGRGLWLSGYGTDLSVAERAVLGRRKMSGDWRMLAGNFELIEALALANADEGFPIPVRAGYKRGRQMSLTAAGMVLPDKTPPLVTQFVNPRQLARDVADLVVAELRPAVPEPDPVPAEPEPAEPAAAVDTEPAPAGDVDERLAAEAAELAAELDATAAAADPDARRLAKEAADLQHELEEANV